MVKTFYHYINIVRLNKIISDKFVVFYNIYKSFIFYKISNLIKINFFANWL